MSRFDYMDLSRYCSQLKVMRNPAVPLMDRAIAAAECSAYEDLVNEQISKSDKVVYLHLDRAIARHIHNTQIAQEARAWLLRDPGVE
jgi:hypothetical protein